MRRCVASEEKIFQLKDGGTVSLDWWHLVDRPIEAAVPANSDSFLLTNLDLVKTTVYGDMTKNMNIYIYMSLYMTIYDYTSLDLEAYF